MIRELERLAFSDVRDLVQWEKRAILGDDGEVTGLEDVMVVKPSHLMTADQATSVRSVTTKSGALKFEMHDKLGALEKLAKVLGLYQEPAAAPVQSVTLNQINFNSDNALEAARRLAFALAKAAQMDRSHRSQSAMPSTQSARSRSREPGGPQLTTPASQQCSSQRTAFRAH